MTNPELMGSNNLLDEFKTCTRLQYSGKLDITSSNIRSEIKQKTTTKSIPTSPLIACVKVMGMVRKYLPVSIASKCAQGDQP